MVLPAADLAPLLNISETQAAIDFGFRFGDRGTHTSRTLMLNELETVLASAPPDTDREVYAEAIIENNVTDKRTTSTRRITNQRLGELYALDPTVPLFRILRLCWAVDKSSRPLLTMLCALARDPLLRATAPTVLSMRPGEELSRQAMTEAIVASVGDRLNDSVIDKVVRNTSSSWTQSGHLCGRVRKLRQRISPTPVAVAYGAVLGYLLGLRGQRLFTSLWAKTLGSTTDELVSLAMDAKRFSLLDLKQAGNIIEVGFAPILTQDELRRCHGTS